MARLEWQYELFEEEFLEDITEAEYLFDDDDEEECLIDDEEEYLIDGVGFADPGGNSGLRAETADNPRIYACPTCGAENVLTRIDRQRGYQCDSCADALEGKW